MSDPKDVHERDQALAEMIQGMRALALGVGSYFGGLIEGGMERDEALRVTIAYVTSANTGRDYAEDESETEGEDWKKER